MRYLLVGLDNYIGIYNGLLLNSIEIDLRRCYHRLLVIKGMNGSGKSTLFNAISVLPDDNNQFIPGMEARKRIEILDDVTGIEYKILFIHGVKKNGERDTTKGYISKFIPGQGFVEMNPNGNISSYKDYIYEEFHLDANFLSLSQLSTEDRGLVDKKPSERKRFVTSIINTLEAYNGMYKIVSKKSSLYKSMINSITTKMNNLGDPQLIASQLDQTLYMIDGYNKDRETVVSSIGESKSLMKVLDPSGNIRAESDAIYHQLETVNIKIDSLNRTIEGYNLEDINRENISDKYAEVQENIRELKTSYSKIETAITMLLKEQDDDSVELRKKIEKLRSLSDDKDQSYYESALKELNSIMESQLSTLHHMGITNINISKDEYITGLNILHDIRMGISALQEKYSYYMIQDAVTNYVPYGKYPDIVNLESEIENLQETINDKEIELRGQLEMERTTYLLKDRPDDCEINYCPFISSALDILKSGMLKDIPELQKALDELKKNKDTKEELLAYNKSLVEAINMINSFLKQIKNYSSLLSKLPDGMKYIEPSHILEKLAGNDSFADINDLYANIDSANIIEEYKANLSLREKLTNEYNVFISKETILQEIRDDIDRINNNLSTIEQKLTSSRDSLMNINNSLSLMNNLEQSLSNIIDLYGKLASLESEKVRILESYNKIAGDMGSIKSAAESIASLNERLKSIDAQLIPLNKKKDELSHALRLMKEYDEEISRYKQNYEKIETIKYYTSPSTGIQTVFMDLYMHKILSRANELLQLVFNGQFVLQPFIINETEFRIPCMGKGLINDDISSMSTSQKCMISMILSFSLLCQSSTKYNVLKIDEIDAGLDTQNRLNFITLLESLMNIINCQQTIMISHNSEIDLSQADVIVLRDDNHEFNSGNIIYRY